MGSKASCLLRTGEPIGELLADVDDTESDENDRDECERKPGDAGADKTGIFGELGVNGELALNEGSDRHELF